MRYFIQNRDYVIFSVLLSLQFVTLPFLGDINNAAKLYVFIFITLIYAFIFSLSQIDLKVSSISHLIAIMWLVFLVFSFQSIFPAWTFIQTLIFAVFLVYLYVVTHKFSENLDKYYCFIDTFLLFSVVAAILGLYEYFHFVLIGPSHTMLIPYLLPPDNSMRVVGVYGQPNLFAVFLTLSILAFYYKYIHLSSEYPNPAVFIFRFIPFGLICVIFFLTESRAGFLSLSLIIGFLSWLVASGRYLSTDYSRKKEFIYLTLCLMISFFIAKGLNGLYLVDARSLGDAGISTEARFIFWTSAVLIFLDHPWFGVGLDNYQFLMNSYGPKSHSLLGFVQYESMGNTAWAHNELLQLACEGGVVVLLILIFLLSLFCFKIWSNFIVRKVQFSPLFLYSHLFLLPFIFQSMFSWPFRSPPLLILFFTFLGGLLAQYPVRALTVTNGRRKVISVLLLAGLIMTSALFAQEVKIGSFRGDLKKIVNIEDTFDEFMKLAENPYSEHRVLSKALNGYARDALKQENDFFAAQILPYYERLCELEGVRYHWYELSHIYLKLGREVDAQNAIQRAIELMPLEQIFWDFSHHLNVLQASRETGRPIRSFYPQGVYFDIDVMGFRNE